MLIHHILISLSLSALVLLLSLPQDQNDLLNLITLNSHCNQGSNSRLKRTAADTPDDSTNPDFSLGSKTNPHCVLILLILSLTKHQTMTMIMRPTQSMRLHQQIFQSTKLYQRTTQRTKLHQQIQSIDSYSPTIGTLTSYHRKIWDGALEKKVLPVVINFPTGFGVQRCDVFFITQN